MTLAIGASTSAIWFLSQREQRPLHYAAKAHRKPQCEILLKAGANINDTDAVILLHILSNPIRSFAAVLCAQSGKMAFNASLDVFVSDAVPRFLLEQKAQITFPP